MTKPCPLGWNQDDGDSYQARQARLLAQLEAKGHTPFFSNQDQIDAYRSTWGARAFG